MDCKTCLETINMLEATRRNKLQNEALVEQVADSAKFIVTYHAALLKLVIKFTSIHPTSIPYSAS